jgi:hypothetical protein
MRWAIVAVVVVVAGTFALIIRPPIKEPALAHELIAMRREVDFPAVSFAPGRSIRLGDLPSELKGRFEDQVQQDQRHQDRLTVLLDRYGWPTEKMVGREAVGAALLVVERAPDADFKQRAVSLMQQVGATHNQDYARVVDLVAVSRGEPQTYGTQWQCESGTFKYLTPVKDSAHLRQRRRDAGLPPADKFARSFCAEPGGDVRVFTPPSAP